MDLAVAVLESARECQWAKTIVFVTIIFQS